MRTHARYEQNGQPPRKTMKVKAEKIKAENKLDEPTKLVSNNNDISMFNQNSLENINELRMKIQENLLANSGLSELSNLKREIKIEFWGIFLTKMDTIIYDIFMIDEKRLIMEMLSWIDEEVRVSSSSLILNWNLSFSFFLKPFPVRDVFCWIFFFSSFVLSYEVGAMPPKGIFLLLKDKRRC